MLLYMYPSLIRSLIGLSANSIEGNDGEVGMKNKEPSLSTPFFILHSSIFTLQYVSFSSTKFFYASG